MKVPMHHALALITILTGLGGVIVWATSTLDNQPGVQVAQASGVKLIATRAATATVTMYSKIETCPTNDCITSSGTTPVAGRTIACPRKYKHGTQVSIRSHVYTCEDRTHLRFDGRFDIYAGDSEANYQQALNFGKQELIVTIL